MGSYRSLALLVLLPSIGFFDTTWGPDVEADVDCHEDLDHATEARSVTPAVEDGVPDGLSANDWASIRDVHEVECHVVHATEGGFQARNPGQQWLTHFDGRGFRTEPDAGAWTWGLELVSYGFSGNLRVVTKPRSLSAEGQRMAYEWDATLEEWYKNDTRGLEHGYIVHQRPAADGLDGTSPLTFTLAVRGGLRPVVDADGRGVRFSGQAGAEVLTYTGLSVVDAKGRELQASFAPVGDRLRLTIDDRGACYPVTIDPIAQQAYLKASNADAWDCFGDSGALSGETLVGGAACEDSSAGGVNGNQSDDGASDAGAAYVFEIGPPGVGYCFGDPGSGTPCPCFNDNDGSVPGSGCANGVFASGALLTGSGVASVSADTLVLSATGLDPNNSGLYFQADNDLSPGTVWGDGLRCAGGQLKRLGVRFSDASGASDTSAWATPISVKAGNVNAGDTKRYQLWYRDTSGGQPCGVGVNDFNASNGYEIVWLP